MSRALRWVAHAQFPGEEEILTPIAREFGISCCKTHEDLGSDVVELVGLHANEQLQCATKSSSLATIALVEFCDQWNATYLLSHGSCCAETLGWATHVIAPTALAQELARGPLASPHAYAEHLDRVITEHDRRIRDGELPYTRKRKGGWPPSEEDLDARRARFNELIRHLEKARWPPNRVIDGGLLPIESPYFDGVRLIPPEAPVAHGHDGTPTIAFVAQGHRPEVFQALERAADQTGFVVQVLPRPPKPERADSKAARVDAGRAKLARATIVATEFSNLAYQAALSGKRVLYCTWRSQARPLPIGGERFGHVKEAECEDALRALLESATASTWSERAEPVPTAPADLIARIEAALEA